MRDFKGYASGGERGWLRDMALLTVALGFLFFQFLGSVPLIDPDEGRYAEIPREMLLRGDFITPTLNYVKYFEKPPLLYWLNAASLKLSGLTEQAARFPSAMSGLLTILATYIIARLLYGRRTALLAALILGTSAGFVLQSRIILTDMLLTLCLTAALGAFIIAARREGRRSSPFPWYAFYLFCALATLTKGLIGIIFPAGIIFLYLLPGKRLKLLREMHLVTGLALFLAIAAPWFLLVSLRNPEFARFFFIHEHFERFTSTVHGRYQPFWFFVPVLAATMLPWSFFIPGALSRAWRNRHHDDSVSGYFLFVWAVLIFLFFSKSNSKLVPYILPIFPPLALLIANRLDEVLDGRGREIKFPSILLGITLTMLGIMVLAYSRLQQVTDFLAGVFPGLSDPLHQFITNAPPISPTAALVVAALFLIQGITSLASAGYHPYRMVITLCCCSFLLEIVIPRQVMVPIAQAESPRTLALQARAVAGPQTQIVTFGPQQAVSWYTQRRIMVTGKPDELEFGSKQGEQSAWFPDQTALLRMWEAAPVLIILKKSELDQLLPLLHPAPRIAGESGRRLLISNRQN